MSDYEYIKIWCEYDFGGSFGGNNNEEVFRIRKGTKGVYQLLLNFLTDTTGLDREVLEGMFSWEYTSIQQLA